jgi:hypothetical protein
MPHNLINLIYNSFDVSLLLHVQSGINALEQAADVGSSIGTRPAGASASAGASGGRGTRRGAPSPYYDACSLAYLHASSD